MAWSTPDALVTGNAITQTNYNDKIVASIVANSFAFWYIGGSETEAIRTGATTYQRAPNYLPFSIPNTNYTGHVYKLVAEVWTENAATTVTPKLRNFTDSTDAVVGSAGTATARGTLQTLTFTLAAGKVYHLMASKSDDLYQAWIMGWIQRTHA
jgi:hypothetical protein